VNCFDHVGMCGCMPSVRHLHSLVMIKIYSTPSGHRMSLGSSIRSPVGVSSTTFAHSVGGGMCEGLNGGDLGDGFLCCMSSGGSDG
jgi:hypothetical protein